MRGSVGATGAGPREEDPADPLAEPRPAGLAGDEDVEARVARGAASALRLGGLAGALGSFDRDEPAGGRRPGSRHAAECTRRSTGIGTRYEPPARDASRVP